MFDHMKEYNIEDLDISNKYKHEVLKWYQKRHLHKVDGLPIDDFKVFRPSRNMDDKVLKAYETVERKWDAITSKSDKLTNKVLEAKIHQKIGNKFVEIGSKTAELGSKIKSKNQSWTSKLKTKFAKKEPT